MIIKFLRPVRAVNVFLALFASIVLAMVSLSAVAAEVAIEMVDTGSGDKRELRFTPQVGSTQTVDFLMNMSVSMGGPVPMERTLPGSKLGMRTTVTGVAPNGDITYSLEVVDATVSGDAGDAQTKATMDKMMATMVGTTAVITVDNLGNSKDAAFTAPPGAPPEFIDQIKQSMKGSSAPLPPQAVGLGAKWKINQDMNENGLSVKQVATYEVTKLTADQVELTLNIVQSATPGPITDPAMPAGVTASLDKLDGKGEGKTVINFGHPMVGEAVMQLNINTITTQAMGEMKQTMDMTVNMATQVKRR